MDCDIGRRVVANKSGVDCALELSPKHFLIIRLSSLSSFLKLLSLIFTEVHPYFSAGLTARSNTFRLIVGSTRG